MQVYKVLGIMSGTSLDGLDLAYCTFEVSDGRYSFNIETAATIPYPQEMEEELSHITKAGGQELSEAHVNLGLYIGREARKFMDMHKLNPDLVSCHGHTVFHQPEKGFSLQIGSGYHIMTESRRTVINDFRSLDVALGGQGAPLVPVGDRLLFEEYDFCLNIGGIANVSGRNQDSPFAFDICPANMILNYLARKQGQAYDAGGSMASAGKILPNLFRGLNQLDFYSMPAPKSLGYEWVSQHVFPLLEESGEAVEDQLNTFCHHIAFQIKRSLEPYSAPGEQRLLVSGGGAYNTFLIKLLQEALKPLNIQVVIPKKNIIEYKEALIFALLGVLRLRGEVNTLASVTGARQDSCGGQVYEYR